MYALVFPNLLLSPTYRCLHVSRKKIHTISDPKRYIHSPGPVKYSFHQVSFTIGTIVLAHHLQCEVGRPLHLVLTLTTKQQSLSGDYVAVYSCNWHMTTRKMSSLRSYLHAEIHWWLIAISRHVYPLLGNHCNLVVPSANAMS